MLLVLSLPEPMLKWSAPLALVIERIFTSRSVMARAVGWSRSEAVGGQLGYMYGGMCGYGWGQEGRTPGCGDFFGVNEEFGVGFEDLEEKLRRGVSLVVCWVGGRCVIMGVI